MFSGGGPDAPTLTRALGMGAHFVLRELARAGIIKTHHAHRLCYVPARRVCGQIEMLGGPSFETLLSEQKSTAIYDFLVTHLGKERATFAESFDLPLLACADDAELQNYVFGEAIDLDDDENL